MLNYLENKDASLIGTPDPAPNWPKCVWNRCMSLCAYIYMRFLTAIEHLCSVKYMYMSLWEVSVQSVVVWCSFLHYRECSAIAAVQLQSY